MRTIRFTAVLVVILSLVGIGYTILSGIHYPATMKIKELDGGYVSRSGYASPLAKYLISEVKVISPGQTALYFNQDTQAVHVLPEGTRTYTLSDTGYDAWYDCSIQMIDERGNPPLFFVPMSRYDLPQIALLLLLIIICLAVISFTYRYELKRLKFNPSEDNEKQS